MSIQSSGEATCLTFAFDSLVDRENLLPLCAAIQKYYQSVKSTTKVLPASLTSVEEVFFLAGVDHLTIAPGLLAQLSTPYAGNVKSLFDIVPTLPIPAKGVSFINDSGSYLITFTRDQGGASQTKLTEVCVYDKMCQTWGSTDRGSGREYILRFPGQVGAAYEGRCMNDVKLYGEFHMARQPSLLTRYN